MYVTAPVTVYVTAYVTVAYVRYCEAGSSKVSTLCPCPN